MDRKLAATFLLSFCVALMAASLMFAADRPYVPMEDRAVIPVKWAPVYGFGGAEDAGFASQQSLGKIELGVTATNAIGTAMGITTYDYQHNGTMGRQVEHRGTEFVHVNWMKQAAKILGDGRRCAYNLVDLAAFCNVDPAADVHTEYGGYVNLDVWGAESWAIPGVHSGPDADHMAPRTYWNFLAASGSGPSNQFSYEDHPVAVYGGYQEPNWLANGLGANEHQNLWPIIEFQTGGTDMYLHMVTAESGGAAGSPQTISYYRRVGPYGDDTLPDGSIIATWSGQCVIDTVEDISPIVTSSQNYAQVCLAWTAPADFRRDQDAEFNGLGVQLCNDVWFARSDSAGTDWVNACEDPATSGTSIQSLIDMGVFTGGVSDATNGAYGVTWDEDGGNITAYGWEYDYKAYTNIAGLITSDEFLHVVWNGRRWTDTTSIFRRQAGVFHWSDDPASAGLTTGLNPGVIRTVVKALWDTGGTCYVGAWQSDVDKIGISECDDKLYVIWAQFGNLALPCYDYESEDKFLNGEIYLSASDDAGFHWDRGQNLTLSESHNCDCGNVGVGANCNSENYPSIARFGRPAFACEGHGTTEVLDLMYVEDLCAGGVVQDGRGIWSVNNVMWFSTPCREVVPEPAYVDDIGFGIGECYGNNPLVINPNTDTTITFTIENTGLLSNTVDIGIRPAIATWLTVTPDNFSVGTGVDNFQVVEVEFTAPTGAPDPSIYVCTLDIVHNADPKITTREVPVCMLVATVFATPQFAVVATPAKRVRIWNTGAIGSGGAVAGDENFDYIDECDTLHPNVNADSYLYSASPVVCRLDGTDTLRFTPYSDTYLSQSGMRPLGWATGTRDSVLVDSTTYTDFTYSKVEFATADTVIGFWNEFFVPKDPTYEDFIVVKVSFWNMLTDPVTDTLHDVLIGEFLDWDIPTDFRTDTLVQFNGPNYTTGNYSGWEKLDSIYNGSQWEYSGVLWLQGAEVNDSLEGDGSGPDFPYCASSIDHSTRYGGIIGDPHSPFMNASNIDNATYVYRAGRTLEPQVIYNMMKNSVGFNNAVWTPGSGAAESTFVDLSSLVTFGSYTLPPGGMTNPRKYTYTFAILGVQGTLDSTAAYADFIQLCKDAEIWVQDHSDDITRHCLTLPGDANNDGAVNVGDQVTLVNFVFKATAPPDCPAEGDANGDGGINVGDAVYLGNYVFKNALCPTNPPVGCPPVFNPPEKK